MLILRLPHLYLLGASIELSPLKHQPLDSDLLRRATHSLQLHCRQLAFPIQLSDDAEPLHDIDTGLLKASQEVANEALLMHID